MRGFRGFITGVAVAGLLALGGCGDDTSGNQTGAGGNGAGDAPSADAESRKPLSRHQFEEIERLYRAQVAAKDKSQGDVAKVAAATKRACRRVDRDDRLLAAMVASCDEVLEFFASMMDTNCDGPKECAPVLRKAVETLDEVLAGLDKTAQVVDETVAGEDCRRALTTPKLKQLMHRMRDAMADAVPAMESGDEKAVEKAGQRFIDVLTKYQSASDVGPIFKRFRQACAPDA